MVGLAVPAFLAAQEPAANQNQQIEQPAEAQSASSEMAVLHGVVRNAAGEPLPRTLVRIDGDASSGALTDGDGRFEIPGVPAGPQEIEVIKPGFLDETAEVAGAGMWENTHEYAHNVMVAAEMPDVVFAMYPTNALRGVIQLSTGDPAQGIGVVLLRQAVENGRKVWEVAAKTKSNIEGRYRFGGLADGLYAIYNDPAMDSEPASNLVETGSAANVIRSGYPSQFYPETRDLAGAAKIRLSGGEQAEADLALTLEPFQSVTATVLLPGGKPGRDGASGMVFSVLVTDAQGHQLPYAAQYDEATHTAQALLPDGSYTMVLSALSRPGLELAGAGSAFSNTGRDAFAGSVDFSVNGHAVTKLRIPLAAIADNSIQVNLIGSAGTGVQAGAGDERARGVMISVSQAGGWIGDGMMGNYAEGSLSGPLESQFTPPGAYWAHTSIADRRFCEGSLTAGGANLGREPLTLGLTGSSAPLSLTLRGDCASLTITLPAEKTIPIAGKEPFYTVYAVPDFASTTDVVPLTLRPSTGGKVTLTGLTPGSYHVYSFDKPVVLAYRDAAALEALPNPGQAVTLSPGSESTLVLEVAEQ